MNLVSEANPVGGGLLVCLLGVLAVAFIVAIFGSRR